MANGLTDIARKLAQATIVPDLDAPHIGNIGKNLITGIQSETQPFETKRKKDVLGEEFAASPFRMNLAKQAGRKDWTKLATEFENKRNEIVNWKPGEKKKVPKTRTVTTVFDEAKLKAMKPGQKMYVGETLIQRNANGSYVFKAPGDTGFTLSTFGKNKNIIDLFGTKATGSEDIPGQFEEREVGGSGKTKDELESELNEIRERVNRVIPRKSDLEKLVGRIKIVQGGKAAVDKLQLEKYKAFERKLNIMASGDEKSMAQLQKQFGDIPFSTIQGYYISYLRNMNNNLTADAIKAGKATNIENTTLNSFSQLDEKLVDRHIEGYKKDINKNIVAINNMKTQSEKLLGAYALLLQIAPTSLNADSAVANAIGNQMMFETWGKSQVNPERDLESGAGGIPRYQDDYRKMAEEVLKTRSKNFKTPIEEKGLGLFDETVEMVRANVDAAKLPKSFWFFKKGTNPDTIREVVRKNLIEDYSVAKFAPFTAASLNNPNPAQKKWIELFKAVNHGLAPRLEDIKKIKIPSNRLVEPGVPVIEPEIVPQ